MDIAGQGGTSHLHASDSPEYCTKKRLWETGKLGQGSLQAAGCETPR